MLSLSVLSKDGCKISVSFKQIQNFKVSHFSMAKVKKVNNAVTYKIVGMVSVKNDQCSNNSATAATLHNEMINF